MAITIDNIGRKIDSTNMSLQEIKSLIGTMMKSKVGAARPVGEEKSSGPNENLVKVRELLEQYTKDFAKEMQEQKGFLGDVVESIKELGKMRDNKKSEPKAEKKKKEKPNISKEEKLMAKASDGMYKTFSKKGSGYVHDIYVERAIRELCGCLKDMTPAGPGAPAKSGGAGAPGGGKGDAAEVAAATDKADKAMKERTRQMRGLRVGDDIAIMSNFVSQIVGELAKAEKAIMGFNSLGTIVKGLVEKEREFVQEARQIAYETGHATKETKALNRAYEDIGKTVHQTGVDRDTFQDEFKKKLKSGIKDLKIANSITKSQLNTEHQLGMKAGALSDEFKNWNLQGRMNVGQIAEMGRGMREVARNTGLTGDELSGVVKSSGDFIKSLRDAATLTAAAAKNVIEIAANAKKLGIESEMQPLLKAMASSSNLILESSQQTKAFLFSAAGSVGRIDDLMKGTILRSKKGIKDMAQGINNVLKQFGVESMEAIDQLSDDAKMRLNISLKATFGIELGQLRQQYEALNEAGKGLADRLADINKKRQQNLTLEEKAALAEEERRLKTSKSLEVLTALDEAAKGAKDMNSALSKFGERRKEFDDDLKAMGISATDNAGVARQALMSAMDNVNAGLKKAGKQEIKIDSSEIEKALKDPAAMRELTAKISKGEQELATAQKAQLDPMNEMAQNLREINDNIRNYVNAGISGLFNSLFGKIAVVGLAVAGVTGGIALLGLNLAYKLDAISRILTEKLDESGNVDPEGGKTVLQRFFGRYFGGKPKPEEAATSGGAAATAAGSGAPGGAAAPAAAAAASLPPLAASDEDIFVKMLAALEAIRNCVCDKATVATGAAATATTEAKAPEPAGKAAAFGMSKKVDGLEDPKVVKAKLKAINDDKSLSDAQKKMMQKDIIYQRKEILMQKRDFKSQRQGDKIQNAQQSLVRDQSKTQKAMSANPCPGAPDTDCLDPKALLKAGGDMLKVGAAIAILAVGVVALAAAVVFLSAKILSAFKLDLGTVLQTAAVVGAVAAAGAAIVAAGVAAFSAMNTPEAQEFAKKAKADYPQVLKVAGALMIMGPAVVLLGAAVVAIAGLILSKLNLNLGTVTETAAILVAVAGVAGAMAAGVAQFVECLDELKKNKTWKKIIKSPGAIAKDIAKGALAILIVGAAIMLLGVALVKMGQLIMSAAGLDGSEAAKVGMQVAGLILAAGAIAGAVIGAAYGLKRLGEFAKGAKGWAKDIAIGGLALLVLAPAMTILAAGVAYMVQGIMGAFGMDAGVAAKVAYDVAGLILSAGLIAGAVIAASAGLLALGSMIWNLGAYTGGIGLGAAIGLMALGAAGLLLMAPAMTALASAVVYMCQQVMGAFGMDTSVAAKAAQDFASILLSAALIAVASIGAGWALAQIGAFMLTGALWWTVLMAGLGAVGLMALTPAITALASAVVWMASAVMKSVVDPAQASKTAEALSGVIGAAAEISVSVLGMTAALALLGLAMTTGVFWIAAGLAVLGAAAMLALTPAVVGLSVAIISMAGALMQQSISPEEGKATAEALASILDSASSISWSVISAAASLGILGALAAFSVLAWILIGTMWLGSKALQALTPAVVNMAQTIINVAKEVISKGVSPEEGKKVAEALASILESAGNIADSVLGMVGKLGKLGILGFFATWIAGLMYLGVEALQTLATPVGQYIDAVVKIAKQFGGSLNPSQAAEMATGVGEVLGACGTVTDEIMKAKDRLINVPVYGGFWAWLTSSKLSDRMREGRLALWDLAMPCVSYIQTVVTIARMMGSALNPKQAADMAKGVAEVLGACGEVTDQIIASKDKLLNVPKWGGFWAWLTGSKLADRMREGVFNLLAISGPVQTYIQTVVGIARRLGGSLDPRLATSMAKGVADILGACGEVTEKIIATKDKLLSIKSSQGFWIWSVKIVDAMNTGVKTLEQMKKPIIDYVGTIVSFAKDMGGKVDVRSAKGMVKSLSAVSKIIELVSKVLDDVATKITPLTQGGWFKASPVKQMTRAKGEMEVFFPAMVDFIKMIVNKVRGTLGDMRELKSAAKSLRAMAMILNAALPAITIMGQKIAPLTQGGFFTASPVQQIRKAIPQFDGFFEAVGEFVNKIVEATKTIKAGPELKDAAKKMKMLSLVLESTGKAITSLSAIVGLMDGGFFSASPIEKIVKNKDQFAAYFWQIAAFVNVGIVWPINNLIPNPKSLQNAAVVLTALAKVLCGTKITLEKLAEVISLMEPRWFFQKAPIQKIIDNKDQFKEWFIEIARFVNAGIVMPVLNEFKDAIKIMAAAKIITAMATIARAVVPMIKNLAAAIALATDAPSFFSEVPMKKIIDSKDQFKEWFEAITIFVRDGIVKPVNKEMAGIDISSATKIIVSMAKIAANIVPLIKNLAATMGLMSSPAERYWDTDFPIDKIMYYKDEFSVWFKSIAIFMRDGIVNPILKELPEARTIQVASKILAAMSRIVTLIPIVINKMANGLIPLIDSGDSLRDTAKEKLDGKTDLFKSWFTSVAAFMRDGIVAPILNELPEARTIQAASKILGAMSRILTVLPIVIRKLSSLFVPLDPNKCLQESPVGMLAANAPMFAEWFWAIANFIRVGILYPIMNVFPAEEEIEQVAKKLEVTNTVVGMLSPFLYGLAAKMSELTTGLFGLSPIARIGSQVQTFAGYFYGIASALIDGIINPIRQLPAPEELKEISLKVGGIGTTIDEANNFLSTASEKMDKFSKGWFWRVIDGWRADMFSATFMNMANAINGGILQPMKLLPSSSEIEEVVKQLDGMVEVLNKVGEVLAAMSVAMQAISESNIDFSPLNSIPVDKMAMFAGALRDMSMAGSTKVAVGGGAGGGGQAGTPSDQAIEQRLVGEQADAQTMLAGLMTQLINDATRGEGLLVRDQAMNKALDRLNVTQADQAKAAIMPSAAQKQAMQQAMGTEGLREALRPAATGLDTRPAAETATRGGVRSAAQTMGRSPTQRAEETDAIERGRRNRFTNRRDERAAARRMRRERAGFGGDATSAEIGLPSGGTTVRTGEAHGVGTTTEQAVAQAIERQAREAEGGQPVGYRLANAASAEQIANQGMMPPISIPPSVMGGGTENAATAALTQANASGVNGPVMPISVEGTGAPANATAAIQPRMPSPDIQSVVQQDRASSEPATTQVVAPELGRLTDEASNQSEQLAMLVELFQKVLDVLQPKSQPNRGSGGNPADTAPYEIAHKPANYFRNTVGLVGQTAGKAALNIGPQST